jgi:2,4-didehydro-3-deoxy-L-rhamnonate hydrolase
MAIALVRFEHDRPGDQMTASIRTDDGRLDLGEQRNRIVAA